VINQSEKASRMTRIPPETKVAIGPASAFLMAARGELEGMQAPIPLVMPVMVAEAQQLQLAPKLSPWQVL